MARLPAAEDTSFLIRSASSQSRHSRQSRHTKCNNPGRPSRHLGFSPGAHKIFNESWVWETRRSQSTPGRCTTVPQGGDRARQAVLDEFMRGDGLQQVCDWIAEPAAPGKGRAKRRHGPKPRRKKQVIAIPTTVRRKLPASQVVPAQGVTGELSSLIRKRYRLSPDGRSNCWL